MYRGVTFQRLLSELEYASLYVVPPPAENEPKHPMRRSIETSMREGKARVEQSGKLNIASDSIFLRITNDTDAMYMAVIVPPFLRDDRLFPGLVAHYVRMIDMYINATMPENTPSNLRWQLELIRNR